MKRIYAFAIGLAMLAAPVVAPLVASADPGTRPMDYQQVSDVVIARGLSQRGVPFSWAGGGINGPTRGTGTGINTVGFDASGLMQYAYAGAGIKLPRSSGAMYKVGQKVLPQQAQKGDLIFYGPEGTQSVAMYLGNNQMLEVGDVVQVSPVRANGMAPYLVRVLGVQSAPVQQLPQAGTDAAGPAAATARAATARAASADAAGPGAADTIAAGPGAAGAVAAAVRPGPVAAGPGAAGAGAAAADAASAAATGARAAAAAPAIAVPAPSRRHRPVISRRFRDFRTPPPAPKRKRVAVFGKLAVDHADPVPACPTGRDRDAGRSGSA